MTVTTKRPSAPSLWLSSVFDRIVYGVDGTESSLAAVRQVDACYRPQDTSSSLLSRGDDFMSSAAADDERNRHSSEARDALAEARRIQPRAYRRRVLGDPGPRSPCVAREARPAFTRGGRRPEQRQASAGTSSAPSATHLLHTRPAPS